MYVLSISSRRLLREFPRHPSFISDFHIVASSGSSSGSSNVLVVTACADGLIRVFDYTACTLLFEINPPSGSSSTTSSSCHQLISYGALLYALYDNCIAQVPLTASHGDMKRSSFKTTTTFYPDDKATHASFTTPMELTQPKGIYMYAPCSNGDILVYQTSDSLIKHTIPSESMNTTNSTDNNSTQGDIIGLYHLNNTKGLIVVKSNGVFVFIP